MPRHVAGQPQGYEVSTIQKNIKFLSRRFYLYVFIQVVGRHFGIHSADRRRFDMDHHVDGHQRPRHHPHPPTHLGGGCRRLRRHCFPGLRRFLPPLIGNYILLHKF